MHLRPFDASTPLQLSDSMAAPPIRHRRAAKTGVGGDMDEMRSIFDACLHVGRMERAAVILERLMVIEPDAQELLDLHNRYLRAAVEQVILNPSKTGSQAIHQWFELKIIKNGLIPNAETIAYMVKVSLHAKSDRRDRLVNRYMGMVTEDVVYQVLCLDILNAQEVDLVVHICPAYNLAEDGKIFAEAEVDVEETEVSDLGPNKQEKMESIPDFVRPVEQKGLGLKALRQSLSLFSRLPMQGIDTANASESQKREIQTRLEEDAVESAIERWREESSQLTKMGLNTALQTKSLGARMWKWQTALRDYIREEVSKVNEAERMEKRTAQDAERVIYGPFLRVLSPEKLAAVTILTVMTSMGATATDRGLPLSTLIMGISHAVEDESAFEVLQQNSKKNVWPIQGNDKSPRAVTPEFLKKVAASHPGSVSKVLASMTSDLSPPDLLARPREWTMFTNAKVGAFLMSAMIETAKVPVTIEHPDTKEMMTQQQPALMHSHQYKMGKKVGMVSANKVLVDQLKREPVHSLLAKHLPMLVSPEPWTEFNKGGFLVHPSKMMRIKLGDKDQRYYAEAAIGHGNMEQTFKGLDVLGKTPWQINQPVFDVMLEAWNTGEPIANIAAESPTFTIPPEPDSADDPLQRRQWIKEVKAMENSKNGLHSQRCFQNFQMEIARALKNETFYFPHNIDFRGRAYPIPPYLNHMGADHCRGLLKFGKGKQLGEGGLKWLKIHCANVFGFDKASLSEREDFATKHLEDIYDSAINPLKGNRWWLKAEDPWQCLAVCVELRNAIESGNPSTFVSNLPVHQDGTCNGLQHYAALGGDSWGAKQVNLEPGDRPADVYTAVANLVKESVARDKATGNPMAIVMDGKITRKTVKQTVMTNVYGVTYIGAKAQVRKQLVSAYPDLPNNDEINPGILSAYIATKIFTALSSMFKGAHDIQYWLGECANRITMCYTPEQIDRIEVETLRPASKARGSKTDKSSSHDIDNVIQFKSSVIWTNPLHMPVVQPYRKGKSRVIGTHLQKISLSEPHRSNPVSKRKQLQGFPPNFIHSLDATHMLLSALRSDELGLSFAAVHDSFWTHACDIPTMNTVLRDAFIRIHSEDVIGRLATEFKARYRGCYYQAKVRTDALVYQKILEWRANNLRRTVWTSHDKKSLKLDELVLERKRMRLLASSDPQEVEEGKAMVTPTSIFQEMAASNDLVPDAELADIGLGDISSRVVHVDLEDGAGEAISDVEVSSVSAGEDLVDDQDAPEKAPTQGTFEKSMTFKASKRALFSPIWLPLTLPPVPEKVSNYHHPPSTYLTLYRVNLMCLDSEIADISSHNNHSPAKNESNSLCTVTGELAKHCLSA